MNSICGIFNYDNTPVNSLHLVKMQDSQTVFEHDKADKWTGHSIALGNVEHHPGTIDEDKIDKNFEIYNGNTVCGISRIYNKPELLNKLSIPAQHGALLSNNMLFLKSFAKWKYECPNHILGEWIFALWNDEERELFIASSHFWKPGLYYYKSSNTFYFSSSIKSLLALDQIPGQINEFRLGQMLVGWNNNLGKTLYKNIHPLKPANTLRVSQNTFEENRYWALENSPSIRFPKDEEYPEAFKEIYTEAIRCRVAESRSVGTTLSGGLDSGSVTALTARELKKQNKTLQSFSSIPLFDVCDFPGGKRFGDETEFINATANFAGNVKVNFTKSEDISPLQGIKLSLNMMDEPMTNSSNSYWLFSTLRKVYEKNIDTLLIGQSGNAAVSWKGLFQGFINWPMLFNSINAGRSNLSNILKDIKRHLIAPLIPAYIYNRLKQNNNILANWSKYSPINDTFAVRQDLITRLYEEGHLNFSKSPKTIQMRTLKPLYGTTDALWFMMGRQHNLWITDVTADKRILEFCTSIPNNQFYKKGNEKYLFKRAMKGILPEKVIYNPLRGRQAADIQQRLLRELPELKSIIESFKKSAACDEYLDINKIESVLPLLEQQTILSFKVTCNVLLRGIAFGLFLQRLE